MKTLDIALKDVRRNLRNAFFLVFGLALPLLTAVLFYFAFSGLASGDGGIDLAAIRVQVVNLDEPQGGFSAGALVEQILRDAIPDIIQVTTAADADNARAAVDDQEAAVAVIIPAGFTSAALAPAGEAAIELYQDPALTLGPSIVKGILGQIVDGFAGSGIAAEVARDQLIARAAGADAATLQGIVAEYGAWSSSLAGEYQSGENPFIEFQAPPDAGQQGNDDLTSMLALIMAGMMVFYVFFTGAASAQSIIQEEEAGTLARLFTTPTPGSAILGGKFISVFALLTVQVITLVIVSSLIFNIDWGDFVPVALVTLGLVVEASGFGIFITSFLKNSRQSGIIFGGVMTVLGMIGLTSVFTAGVPGGNNPMSTASLVVPHGWGVRGWRLLLEQGGSLTGDILLTVAVTLVLGIVFFTIGVLKFRKRFA